MLQRSFPLSKHHVLRLLYHFPCQSHVDNSKIFHSSNSWPLLPYLKSCRMRITCLESHSGTKRRTQEVRESKDTHAQQNLVDKHVTEVDVLLRAEVMYLLSLPATLANTKLEL